MTVVRADRVLHVITDTDRRGSQVFANDLTDARAHPGDRLVALTAGTSEAAFALPTLGTGRRHPSTLRALRREMLLADVAVAHGSSTLVACAVAGLGSGTPFVYRQISDQRFWAGTLSRRARVRTYLSRAAHVVALWSGAAETLHREFSVPTERITVIPNAVSTERFPLVGASERAAARGSFGMSTESPTVLSIGALEPEKGVDVAIRAMAELHDKQLLVIGSGREAASLKALANRLAPDRVFFSAPISDPRRAYAAADALVLPSRGGDSMPAVLIEAGLRGLPSVATPVEGIVDIIQPSTGRLVPTDDAPATAKALAEVLADRTRMGLAAHDHCRLHFTIEAVAPRWSALLERLVSARNAP